MELQNAMEYDSIKSQQYKEAGWWRDDTLQSWLAKHVNETPHSPAIKTDDKTINYEELAKKVSQLAGALQEIGVSKGDIVSIQIPNCPEFIISYLAMNRLGAVMSTLPMPYRVQEFTTLLNHNQACAVICLSDSSGYPVAETLLGLKNKIPTLQHVIALGAPLKGALSLSDLINSHSKADATSTLGSDPLLLLYTSGTTSAPKGVPLSHWNMLSNARLGVDEHQLSRDDVILSLAPFSHLLGLYTIHLALSTGACNLLLPTFTPPTFVKLVESKKPTVLFAAPAHISACLGSGLLDKHDISSLQLAILSGSTVPSNLVSALKEKIGEGHVGQLWGMTELQAGLYTRPSDSPDLAGRSAGRPSPGTEVRIMKEDNTRASTNEEGELQIRGCSVFSGYLKNDEANQAAFTNDGWFRTGDLATQNEAGNVSITGRIKDIINRGGIKYNPLDVEDLLNNHPKIAQSAIVPMPDPVLGEKACCFVVLAGEETLTLDEIGLYLGQHNIAKIKYPERLEIIKEMPLTPTRKIIKGLLKVT